VWISTETLCHILHHFTPVYNKVSYVLRGLLDLNVLIKCWIHLICAISWIFQSLLQESPNNHV